MTTNCVVDNCKEQAMENYQFCQKHALEYPEMAEITQINFKKEALGINELRVDLLKTLERHYNLNSISTMIAVASAAAQILATQAYNTGAKNQDIMQYLFTKMFREQYKITIDAIKNDFIKWREKKEKKNREDGEGL